MRHYEIVLLIHPDQSEQVEAMLRRYRALIKAEKGVVHRLENWGRRRLAYMIADLHKAHYVLLNIECALETLRELEKNFKFNDSILRSLVIRRDRAHTEETPISKANRKNEELKSVEKLATTQGEDAGDAKAATTDEASSPNELDKPDKLDESDKSDKPETKSQEATDAKE